jgi:hypothetical protein
LTLVLVLVPLWALQVLLTLVVQPVLVLMLVLALRQA